VNIRLVAGAALLATIASVAGSPARAADSPGGKNVRILMVTQSAGFRHGSVTRKDGKLSVAEQTITDLAAANKFFSVDCTQDVAADLTREALDSHNILFFYTTGNLPIKDDVKDYLFNDWIKQKGHGFIGTHSAADTYKDYEPYWEMLGGTFDGHPWGAGEVVTVTVHDTKHPVSKPWAEEFIIRDEIYRFKHWQPDKVHVLMSLNMAKTNKKEPYHVPVAWVKNYGEGRVFHMSLGHREDVWENKIYQQSLINGIKWVAGMEQGDATPNPELSAAQDAKAKEDCSAAKAK